MPIKTYPREHSPLYGMPSRRKLAELLRINTKQLRRLSGDLHLYSHFPVAKKDGSSRMVDNPRDELKRVQRKIAKFLGRILPSDILFCPVKGRSYVDNAAQHRSLFEWRNNCSKTTKSRRENCPRRLQTCDLWR